MTETIITSGGPAVPTETLVQTDQDSILGDGSHGRPLHAGPGGVNVEFTADFASGVPIPGTGVIVSLLAPTSQGAIARVQPASGASGFPNSHHAVGILSRVTGGLVRVQFSGPLTLTTAQWDAITGGSGGLTTSDAYYLAVGGTADGRLTVTRPSGSGDAIVQVGVALNRTTLLLSTPSAVILVP